MEFVNSIPASRRTKPRQLTKLICRSKIDDLPDFAPLTALRHLKIDDEEIPASCISSLSGLEKLKFGWFEDSEPVPGLDKCFPRLTLLHCRDLSPERQLHVVKLTRLRKLLAPTDDDIADPLGRFPSFFCSLQVLSDCRQSRRLHNLPHWRLSPYLSRRQRTWPYCGGCRA